MPDPTPAATPFKVSVTDVTPPEPKIRKSVVLAADIPALLQVIDPEGPKGKGVRSISVGFDAKGDLTFTITYNP